MYISLYTRVKEAENGKADELVKSAYVKVENKYRRVTNPKAILLIADGVSTVYYEDSNGERHRKLYRKHGNLFEPLMYETFEVALRVRSDKSRKFVQSLDDVNIIGGTVYYNDGGEVCETPKVLDGVYDVSLVDYGDGTFVIIEDPSRPFYESKALVRFCEAVDIEYEEHVVPFSERFDKSDAEKEAAAAVVRKCIDDLTKLGFGITCGDTDRKGTGLTQLLLYPLPPEGEPKIVPIDKANKDRDATIPTDYMFDTGATFNAYPHLDLSGLSEE